MRPRVALDERGLASAQAAFGLALAVLVLLFAANVVAIQYTRAALYAAAAAGARAGALVGGSEADCEHRAREVLLGDRGLLAGRLGETVEIVCRRDAELVSASVAVPAWWWIDFIPEVDLVATAEAVAEDLRLPVLMDLPPRSG